MKFCFEEDTVDDLMNEVFKELLNRNFDVETTRGQESGPSSEIVGAFLKLTNPRARLSRTETKGTLFSALGETLWYLSKSNDLEFIKYYIKRYKDETEDNKTIYGAYGPRLFNSQERFNQINNVIALLSERPTSRRAAIQIFEARDLFGKHKEIPCTCTLQFLIRDNLLHMITYMRSNDAFWGLPHDIFAFTMLQEIIARTLGVDIGTYSHSVGSLHLYQKMKADAETYIKEGVQPTKKIMEAMPQGDPWNAIETILQFEQKCRAKEEVSVDKLELDPFWKDLALIIQIHSLFKSNKLEEVIVLKQQLNNEAYKTFIEKRLINANREKNA